MNIKLLPLILWCLRRDFDHSPSLYMVWLRLPRDVSHSHTQPLCRNYMCLWKKKWNCILKKNKSGGGFFNWSMFYCETILLCLVGRSPGLYMVWLPPQRYVSHSHTQPPFCAYIVSAEEKMELLLRKANLGLSSFTEASFYAKTSLLWFLCNIRWGSFRWQASTQ